MAGAVARGTSPGRRGLVLPKCEFHTGLHDGRQGVPQHPPEPAQVQPTLQRQVAGDCFSLHLFACNAASVNYCFTWARYRCGGEWDVLIGNRRGRRSGVMQSSACGCYPAQSRLPACKVAKRPAGCHCNGRTTLPVLRRIKACQKGKAQHRIDTLQKRTHARCQEVTTMQANHKGHVRKMQTIKANKVGALGRAHTAYGFGVAGVGRLGSHNGKSRPWSPRP